MINPRHFRGAINFNHIRQFAGYQPKLLLQIGSGDRPRRREAVRFKGKDPWGRSVRG
ncbi:hypothetical protein NG791_26085 [Laspinema sp. D1]|uniref:hypothetical protein n=1 Tax=Laspinema palackyanum TaxID=3231601 RepID=UPI0034900303|nr:hypothetical protein [Laspinema sp. D2b]